jgi:hypothetical protein
MRIFSPAMFGFGSDAEVDAAERSYYDACRRYARYLRAIAPACPEGIRRFSKLNLHDAMFTKADLSRRNRLFTCSFDCTRVTAPAPKRVRLEFRGVSEWLGPSPKAGDEWLYEELELVRSDYFRLTLIFWRGSSPRMIRSKICSWCFSALRCTAGRPAPATS